MKVIFQTRKLFTFISTNENNRLIGKYNFSFEFTASSESERDDGYDLSTQFDDVPQETSDNEEVNVDQELAIERSLRRWHPAENREKEVDLNYVDL